MNAKILKMQRKKKAVVKSMLEQFDLFNFNKMCIKTIKQ